MTITKIIDGLYFTIGMILFNPLTGESKIPEELNEDDKITYDACIAAIEILARPKARWINIPNKPEWDQKMCSICGDYFCCQNNYCPNCGAEMEYKDD